MEKTNKTEAQSMEVLTASPFLIFLFCFLLFIFLLSQDIKSVLVTSPKSGQGFNFYGERQTNTEKFHLGK